MYTRLLKTPTKSAFLAGPRGIGKTTWLRERFPDADFYDLLNTRLFLQLMRDTGMLYQEQVSRPKATWIVIDEIQRIPGLLNEVHRLIENKGRNVVMSGSSARKLRRGGVNLLAARALVSCHTSYVA